MFRRSIYLDEVAKRKAVELELKQANDTIRNDLINDLADANRALRTAEATIAELKRRIDTGERRLDWRKRGQPLDVTVHQLEEFMARLNKETADGQ